MNLRFRGPIVLGLVLFLSLTVGCASSGKKKGGARKRTVLLTSSDDVRAGAEASKSVEADIGLLDNPELTAYVSKLGNRLLRGLPQREYAYKFLIVDQMEPNAFALPGGHIYVSRGLLALINNVDELACVLGHEIVHSAKRHAAQQQVVARNQGLSLPMSRAATMASYGRDMEREADALGQRLCAAAGYDPMGMATFMRSLEQRERLLIGYPRTPTFLDTHPGSRERASANSARASELRWTRDPKLGDVRKIHLNHIDGMIIGDRPETGVFAGDLFMHPGLGFEMSFPKGWLLRNSARAVGAMAPRGEAAVYLTGDLPPGELTQVANDFAVEVNEDYGAVLTKKEHVRLGDVPAVRYSFKGGGGTRGAAIKMTFFPFAGATWRMVGVAPAAAEKRYFGRILLSMRTFGPLTDEHRALIHTDRLRVVLTRPGENFVQFDERNASILDPVQTAQLNGLFGNEVFEGGELMKVVRRED